MKKATPSARVFSVAATLGLVTASLACLCVGALVAVTYDRTPRVLFAGAGFCGYLFFFAHALRGLALPAVLIESRPRPDGELRREPAFQRTREAADRNRVSAAAA